MDVKKGQIYKCEICGNEVEVVEASYGELVCCGEPMTLKEDVEEKDEE